MLVAAITDLVEPMDRNLHQALSRLQKQVKYGLRSPSATSMFEVGFADRVVATALEAVMDLDLRH
jgi:hypothetical protein